MGKAKALRLGIVKGTRHVFEKVQKAADKPFVGIMIARLRCTRCGHKSDSHERRRPVFENMDAHELLMAIQSTGRPGSGGFDECLFYFCDECERLEGCAI